LRNENRRSLTGPGRRPKRARPQGRSVHSHARVARREAIDPWRLVARPAWTYEPHAHELEDLILRLENSDTFS
jgi:hypothetical protein